MTPWWPPSMPLCPSCWSHKMTRNKNTWDKIIIGAGLYGLYAAKICGERGERVLVLEWEKSPFQRATYINQARVHMGYHYPRSLPRRSNRLIILIVLSRIMISAFTVNLIRFTPPATVSAGPIGSSSPNFVRRRIFPVKNYFPRNILKRDSVTAPI